MSGSAYSNLDGTACVNHPCHLDTLHSCPGVFQLRIDCWNDHSSMRLCFSVVDTFTATSRLTYPLALVKKLRTNNIIIHATCTPQLQLQLQTHRRRRTLLGQQACTCRILSADRLHPHCQPLLPYDDTVSTTTRHFTDLTLLARLETPGS